MQFQVLTVLARTAISPALERLILDNRLPEAVKHAEVALRERETQQGASRDEGLLETAHLCADLMLALDRAEEAQETYRLAVKLSHHMHRGDVRVASCRSTGLLALHQHRFSTAASCFMRIASDDAATVAQRTEALCALAFAHEGLGQQAAALQALARGAQLASQARHAGLSLLTGLVRIELSARNEIRNHELLQDHVFWRSSLASGPRERDEVSPLQSIDKLLAADAAPLIAQRLRHLRDLLLAAHGNTRLQPALMEHLAHLRTAGLVRIEAQARLDTALVAITQRQVEFARAVLKPLQGASIEKCYCQAKVYMLLGCADDAMQYYKRYAFESMERVRAASATALRGEAPVVATSGAKDDIEMRLPAKYRRAYRYLLDNLDHADLSVREISDSVGVTERAIQTAFKAHLGMTPGEVLQRCRVERIRAELLREDANDASVIETAARWGIRNRSTLLSSYRKFFSETPTQTLARRRFAGQGTAA